MDQGHTVTGAASAQGLIRETREAEALVDAVNTAGFILGDKLTALERLSKQTYLDRNGQRQLWLTLDKYAMLSIRRGTLSDEERDTMQSHVVTTDKQLAQIPLSPELSHVQDWAASHHEFLNGTGYPKHLSGEDIPIEVRIFDDTGYF